MKYQITSDNIQITPSMESLAMQKMTVIENKLKHVGEELKTFRIVLNTAPLEKFTVKIHGTVNGKEYFTDETDYSLEHAMIAAVNEMERKLQKDRMLENSKTWRAARNAKHANIDNPENV